MKGEGDEAIEGSWRRRTEAAWATVTVTAYGREQVRHLTEVTCLWYGSWHTRPVRLILSRDEHTIGGLGPFPSEPCGNLP